MSFSRAERVADLISKALSTALITEVRDERLRAVSISAVVLTGDLSSAKIYWLPLMEADVRKKKTINRAFVRANPFLRRYISQNVHLKHTPELTFLYDESIKRGRDLKEVIKEAVEEDELPKKDL